MLAADEHALRALVDPDVVRTLKRRDPHDTARVDATCRWLESAASDAPRDIVVLGDPRYPVLLLETADPPLLLFTLGRVELLTAPSVAIVGSRGATPEGMDNARAFARFLSEHRLTIVSGLAMGIDGAAHEGGLAGPGSTVAFVGTGLDRVYPPRHAGLARRIAEQGLVASEYPLGMSARPESFPRRNRLIAGISRGTLVVEAALESGSLITARMALEEGREVLAIPGSIHSPQSRGCHRLIQDGAKLVECGADVLQELRLRRATMSGTRRSRRCSRRCSPWRGRPTPATTATPSTRTPRCGPHWATIRSRLMCWRLAPGCRPTSWPHGCWNWNSRGWCSAFPAACCNAARWPERGCHGVSASLRCSHASALESTAIRCKSGPRNDDFTKVQQRPASRANSRRAATGSLRYSGFMFDVLVYLYENYWRPDACPDHDQLSRKLTAVGFETDEIQEALHWLDGLADTSQGYTGTQSEDAIRLYSDRELDSLGETSIGFVCFLEAAGVLPPPMREMVIDRAMAAGGNPLDLDDMKIIILMVFWSLGEEPDALILDELFVAPEERLIH